MPIPKPNDKEDKQKFVSRCMSDEVMKKDYPDSKQRIAICLGQTRKKSKSGIFDYVLDILGFSLSHYDCEECGNVEELTLANFIIPQDSDYVDFNEPTEELDIDQIVFAKFEYTDPDTKELYYFEKRGNYKKNDKYLRYQGKAEKYQGRKVTLNKPFRTPNGPKKFSVYVKNDKGNVVKVNFGDPNMKIKKNIPSRRKSFRARMNCDNPGP
ncbi:MAG: hypothetical protein ACKO7N_01805, partial [Candidatus Nitrosotenuis sp.]